MNATGFCILSACSESRDPCAEARWRFRLRFLRFPFFVVLKLDVRAKRGRRATRLFRRRGRTPLATACAAHFVRGICRYGADDAEDTLPTANYPLPSNNTRLTTKKNSYNYAVFFLKNNTRWHWNVCSKKVGGMQFIASMSLVATSATLPRRPAVATSATLPRRPAVAEERDPPA